MKIIDAHVHFSNIQSFKDTAKNISFLDYSKHGYQEEFSKAGVVGSVAMGLVEHSQGAFPDFAPPNPMAIDLDDIPNNMIYCLGINPWMLKEGHRDEQIKTIDNKLKDKRVVGIKIYAGYYPYHVYDEIYSPIYELAAKHNVVVYIHSGDTYSDRGLLKYSHPLNIDELAVFNREVNFVVCHMGDPWVMDCAEVVSKNPNVYADLSGLIVGDSNVVRSYQQQQLFVDHIKRAIIYCNSYHKLLYGSDWPLVQVAPYIEFIKSVVPKEHHEDVFYNNALRLIQRLREFI
jgi:uncharacterized protein